MAGSLSTASYLSGASICTWTFFGVGYSTLKVSIWASQPNSLNFFSMNSALALLCGEPTWFGADDSSFEPFAQIGRDRAGRRNAARDSAAGRRRSAVNPNTAHGVRLSAAAAEPAPSVASRQASVINDLALASIHGFTSH